MDNTTQHSAAQGGKTAVAASVPKGILAPASGDLRLGRQKTTGGLSSELLMTAIVESLRKLDPRTLMRNPVMFVVEIVALLTTVLVIRDAVIHEGTGAAPLRGSLAVKGGAIEFDGFG